MTAIYVLLYLRFFIVDTTVRETMNPAGNIIIWILFYFGLFVSVLIDSKILKIGENK